ncbi:esterase [Parafrankia colletiae]|uniref:Esterase n=1 Tax=Parafrankia colletiae TaxID=573497 RepID=A0A1S1Q4C7_9ACTN|nr:alpha/beta fold hydrolase [Parafrankia colletiae]MCK9903929.1 alpha/beta fold hydrolase [Frankia sp. Cpl3]OHV28810.1 esterase [Parafrankia colletiae]
MPTAGEPTTFVLLHGGRHGGWCWRPVATRLRAAGYDVHTPTLTGLGDRAHLLSRQVGLDTHTRDLVAMFEFEDVHDAVLVVHSYGGMVLAGAMEHLADRVRSVVLLDAHLPRAGESMLDLLGATRAAQMVALADEAGEGWYIPPTNAAYYGVTDPGEAAWVEARMTAQPLRTYRDPVAATARAWDHPTLFVECRPTALEPQMLSRARERSTADPRFQYRVLETSHNAMVTDPGAVTTLLIEAASLPAVAR